MELICPICGEPLCRTGRTLRCAGNHCFDIARQGYVNLLPVQQKHSRNPGDTREQVLARRNFLDAGHYAPIARTLVETAQRLGATGPILDVGCGEGYYSAALAQALGAELTGLDISKEAVRFAGAKYRSHQWLCATASHIPVAAQSAGTLTSLFALTLPEEFARVLRPEGYFFQVLAGEDHLPELKKIIYPEIRHRQKQTSPDLPGFRRLESIPIRFSFTVEGPQVRELLAMTPHWFRISRAGAEALDRTERLTDTASCILNVYQRC